MMNSTNKANSFDLLPWSKEWAAYMENVLLWEYQIWKTRCNSPVPVPTYSPDEPLPQPPIVPVLPPTK
jgi:hypothetical protein